MTKRRFTKQTIEILDKHYSFINKEALLEELLQSMSANFNKFGDDATIENVIETKKKKIFISFKTIKNGYFRIWSY